jgi:putative membrane protein
MPLLSSIPVGVVAGLHAYILTLEMFLWTTPRGRKAFGMKAEFAEMTKTLAANQGLYNGFLSAGLVWGLSHPDAGFGKQIQLFFLGCVLVAGTYGAATVKPRIFMVQGVPALVGLAAVIFS